jgi:lipoprotein-releasing system ATP-binding protein
MIKVEKLYKSYTGPEGKQEVLVNCDIDFPKGKINAIVGASGSGKSTLLNIIASIDTPDSGDIYYPFVEKRLKEITDRESFRNRYIGFVFQAHNLLPEFSILENITLPAIIANKDTKTYLPKAEELIERCGISHIKHKRPTQVSGGEAQRAAIARALINNPQLILADEPTGNLDEQNSRLVLELLLSITSESGSTVIMATHSQTLASLCDNIYIVSDKKVSPSGVN